MVYENEDAERESAGGGGKRLHSPGTTPENSKRRELDQHVSVIEIADINSEPATTPVTSGTKVTTPRNILLSPINMDLISMIEDLKDPRKLGNKDITNELLYNIICGQESRLFKLEKDVFP